ncbi:MAG: hypothetical protein QM638_19630 [Nocardioides sp.]|uniref:hypothetical protein n=1 Tax=Nocardioides sp. TaxID=35761 RepID=UPI0039E55441
MRLLPGLPTGLLPRLLPRLLTGVGAVALVLGLVAGVVNRQVVDTGNFVAHADAVRTEARVSDLIGDRLTDRVLEAKPDLVLVRPLLQSTLQGTVRSAAFAPAFRAMLAPLHQAVVHGTSGSVLLRLADIGAILTAALRTVAPEAAGSLPDDLDVRLATIGAGSVGGELVGHARVVRALSWALPLLALVCFLAAVLLHRRRRRGLRDVGVALVGVGAGIGVLLLGANYLTGRLDTGTVRGALTAAGWSELAPSFRSVAVLTVGVGALLVAGVELVGGRSPRGLLGWAYGPATTGIRLGRSAAALVAGVFLLLEPRPALTLIAMTAGMLLLVAGVIGGVRTLHVRLEEVSGARASATPRTAMPSPLRHTGFRTTAVAATALLLLAGIVAWNTHGSTPGIVTPRSAACNGSAALCERPYNEVAFPATHNSMAAADQPGWFLAEQPNGIIDQLDAGIRVFLIDTWYGQTTQRPGVVVNTDESMAAALASANTAYGDKVVQSALRLRDSARLTPRGSPAAYLCHALCVLGSTKWEPLMVEVAAWLKAHPREVVTFFLQDEVSPATTAGVVRRAGLMPYVYTPATGPSQTWPTLGQMIDSGHRLVFLAEHTGGGSSHPWLLQGFDWVQDTPFDARVLSDFSCRRNRGKADAKLFLVNHWLNQPLSRVSASASANRTSVLENRLAECEQQRGMMPNFVAVDNYDQGGLFQAVDRLNGLG